MGWRTKVTRKGGSRPKEHGDDETDREECCEPDNEIASAEMSASSSSHSPKEKGGWVRSSSEHLWMAVVKIQVDVHPERTWMKSGKKRRNWDCYLAHCA